MNERASSMTKSAPPEQTPSPRALLQLAPYLLRYKPRIVAALLAVTVAAAATLAVPLAIRRMIDFGFSAESAGMINSYFFALVAVAAVLALASGSRFYFVTTLGERVVADLRTDVFKHLCRLDAAFFDTARTGELMSRLTADTTQMKSAFGSTAAVALRNFFLFAGAVAMMVYTSPKLSAAVLIAIPIIVLPLVASGRLVHKRSRTAQDTLAGASAYAAENLAAVRVMQAFGAEPHHRPPFRRRRGGSLCRRPQCRPCSRRPHDRCDISRLREHCRRALVWRAGRSRWPHDWRLFVAVRALRHFGRGRIERVEPGVGRNIRRRRRGRPDRRDSCLAAGDRGAGSSHRAARAGAGRNRLRTCRFRLSGKIAKSPPCTAFRSR